MTETKHTPGPWVSQGWVPTWAYIPVHDSRHNLVASLYPDSGHNYTRDEVEANARLVAAAPDLLEALQGLHAFVGAMFGVGADAVIPDTVPTPLGVPVKVGAIMADATAAIAKALPTPHP